MNRKRKGKKKGVQEQSTVTSSTRTPNSFIRELELDYHSIVIQKNIRRFLQLKKKFSEWVLV